MSGTLGALVVEVSANVARFQSDMGKVAGIAETAVKRVEQTSTIAASALKSVGTVLAGAFAVGALKSFAAATIEGVASLKDLSEQTGASVENLSALRSVAKLGGRDIDAIALAMGKLTKGLSGSDEETKGAAQGIQDLGLNLQKFKQLDPAQQFKAIADKLIDFKDNANKAALSYELFGKTGATMLPFLKDLAEQGDLVGKVTKEQAEQADHYEKNLRALAATSEKLKKELVIGMLPALADITTAMRQAAKESGTLMSLWVGLGGLFAKSTIGQALDVEGVDAERRKAEQRIVYMQKLGEAIENNQRLAEKGDQRATVLLARQRVEMEGLIALQAKSSETLKSNVAKSAAKEPEKPSLPERKTDPRPKTPGESFIEQLQRQLQQQEKGRFEMLRLESAQKGVSQAAAPYIRQLEDIELRQERIKRTVEEVGKEEEQRARVTNFVSGGNDIAKGIIDQTEAMGLNEKQLRRLSELRRVDEAVQRASVDATSETRQELEKLAVTMRANVIAAIDAADKKQTELNANWQYGATEALRKYGEEAANTSGQIESTLTNAFKSAEDALVNFVKTGKLDFKSLADSIISDLIRIQVKKTLSGASGFLGGLFGGGAGAASTGAELSTAAGLPIGTFATGLGYVPYDGMPAILHEGERVMTRQENQGSARDGSGGQTIVQNNYIDSRTDAASVAQIAASAAQQAVRQYHAARVAQGAPI